MIQSPKFVHLIFSFEICSFVIKFEILDKNEILLAHIIPTGANPDIVRPNPTPTLTEPIEFCGTVIDTFFLSNLSLIFLNIHYEF